MINFRVIARVFSLVLIIEGLFMLLSAGVSFIYHESVTSGIFFSGIITFITGLFVFTPLRNEEKISGNKEGYIIVSGIWLILSLFGTLPYILSGSVNNFGNAFFESVSGFTTTGATILTDIESMPHGILFWRSLTQWIGAIGFILISLSIIPVIKTINIQLTITDFTGQAPDKIHPRTREAGKRLVTIFAILTLTETVLLLFGGMPLFDAVCNSFSTMSTGGFTTKNYSMSSINSPFIIVVITLFMFIAGTNLTLIYFGIKGYFRKVMANNEFLFYCLVTIIFILIVTSGLRINEARGTGSSFIEGSFQVVSIITTTGFYHADYTQWSSFIILLLFILMFSGGTSGSASGSIKIIRLLLTTKNARQEMKKIIHPSAYAPVRADHRIVPQLYIHNLLVFITLYFFITCFSALITSLMGYDIITSFSTSASMIGNIGPALGEFGPFTSYSSLPAAGKWFFSFLMITGRLELFTVLVLFTRDFFRR